MQVDAPSSCTTSEPPAMEPGIRRTRSPASHDTSMVVPSASVPLNCTAPVLPRGGDTGAGSVGVLVGDGVGSIGSASASTVTLSLPATPALLSVIVVVP